jgi:hypothetical protein
MRSLALSLVLLVFGCEAIFTDLSFDAGRPDTFPPSLDTGPPRPRLISEGVFEGRGGYSATGNVRFERIGGDFQVVFSDDFTSADVPSPIVVLTRDSEIETPLDRNDVILTVLSAEQTSGAGTYISSAQFVPLEGFIFIYSEALGVETARAQMVAVP